MQVTPETISGRKVTVIRRPFDAERVRESLTIGVPVVAEHKLYGAITLVAEFGDRAICFMFRGIQVSEKISVCEYKDCVNTIVQLDPLPSRPKPEDAWRLYKYASEGLFAVLDYEVATGIIESHVFRGVRSQNVATPWLGEWGSQWRDAKITHVVDSEGNRHDVAIEW